MKLLWRTPKPAPLNARFGAPCDVGFMTAQETASASVWAPFNGNASASQCQLKGANSIALASSQIGWGT